MATCSIDRSGFAASVEELRLGVSFHDLAEHFHTRPDFALLESQTDDGDLSRFSFFSFAPFARLRAKGPGSTLELAGGSHSYPADAFRVLRDVLDGWSVGRPAGLPDLPFLGGAIGYFGYELGQQIEVLPARAVDDLGLPDCYLCFYNFAVALDRESGTMFLCHLDTPGAGLGRAKDETIAELRAVPPRKRTPDRHEWGDRPPAPPTFVSDLSRPAYVAAVQRIKEYILAGDVYQVNLTQRFCADIGTTPPWELYTHLSRTNPAPFAAFLNFEGHAIVSSSPERFLRIVNGQVETRPIKGTIARGATPDADLHQRRTLLDSRKNRAELAMIVDLLRNDLGRVCVPGSVRVREFPRIESYASVHHLVATISGELASDRGVVDVLLATFPGGSITGAPKIRAMEIIDEMEPVARGVYTGGIGYIGLDGSADLNIAIRTLIVKDGKAFVHAGGGIVADSVEADEYEESVLKASKLLQAVHTVCGSGAAHER